MQQMVPKARRQSHHAADGQPGMRSGTRGRPCRLATSTKRRWGRRVGEQPAAQAAWSEVSHIKRISLVRWAVSTEHAFQQGPGVFVANADRGSPVAPGSGGSTTRLRTTSARDNTPARTASTTHRTASPPPLDVQHGATGSTQRRLSSGIPSYGGGAFLARCPVPGSASSLQPVLYHEFIT